MNQLVTSTQDRVLEIQELFQVILYQLPTRDLLLAQRVCRKWHDTISTTPMLQEALFFRQNHSQISRNYHFNELLAQVFPPWFRQCRPHAHPFQADVFTQLPWAQSDTEDWRKAVLYKQASWRRMFVCRRALMLVVGQTSFRMGGNFYREGMLKPNDDNNGWTMGLLYDLTYDWIFHHRVGMFGLDWSCFPIPSVREGESEEAYQLCMRNGLALVDAVDRGEFKPMAKLRLQLAFVKQCTGEERPGSVDGRLFKSGVVQAPKSGTGVDVYETLSDLESDKELPQIEFSEYRRIHSPDSDSDDD